MVANEAVMAGNDYVSEGEVHDYMGLNNAVLKKQTIINKALPEEEKQKASKRLEDTYSISINPDTPGFVESYNNDPIKGKVDINQYAGLETLRLFEPEKYKNYVNILNENLTQEYELSKGISFTQDGFELGQSGEKETQQSINQHIGKEVVLRELNLRGINNANDNAVKERLDLIEEGKNAVTDEQKLNVYVKGIANDSKFEALKQENDHLKEQNQQFEASLMRECSLSQTLASEKAVIKDTIKELLSSINSLETSR